MPFSGPVAYYRLYAARCLETSQRVLDAHSRSAFLAMAQAWNILADQADKNRETTLVYETPEPRPREQHQTSTTAAPSDVATTPSRSEDPRGTN
jgi:hypothetical protein